MRVSDGGTPCYSVSIKVLPGISGMATNLALSFSGPGVNSRVRSGWSVQEAVHALA